MKEGNGTVRLTFDVIRTAVILGAISWNLLATVKLKEDVASMRASLERFQFELERQHSSR